MADGGGTASAVSIEDTPSESCMSCENTDTSFGAEEPSSPPSQSSQSHIKDQDHSVAHIIENVNPNFDESTDLNHKDVSSPKELCNDICNNISESNEAIESSGGKFPFNNPASEVTDSVCQLSTDDSQLNADDSQLNADDSKQLSADDSCQLNADDCQLNADDSQMNAENSQLNDDDSQLNTENSQSNADESQLNADDSQLNADDSKLNTDNSRLNDLFKAIDKTLEDVFSSSTSESSSSSSDFTNLSDSHNEEDSFKKVDNEDRNQSGSCEKTPQFKPVLYSGFKKKDSACKIIKPERRIIAKGNPFSSTWKKGVKSVKSLEDNSEKTNLDISSTSESNFQDCTHYLGLQPSINFRCHHCGISGFESIQLLNLHQGECRKVLGHSTSTNIKITRKVYLCSACGTYYESWHLFYHMRKVHDKFMCLYCLNMFSYSEKLCDHLMSKHQVNFINFPDLDNFKKCNLSSYLFLCLECDNVMSDTENFRHNCTPQKVMNKAPSKQLPSVSMSGAINPPKSSSKKSHEIISAPKSNSGDESISSDPSDICHVDISSKADNSAEESVEPVKEPVKASVLSEFPKIGLQRPKNLNDSNKSDSFSDSIFPDNEEERKISSSSGTPKLEFKVSRNKRAKRKFSSARQSKRHKLDPDQQKSVLENLTKTIDDVAKNYGIDTNSSLPESNETSIIDEKSDGLFNHEPPTLESSLVKKNDDEDPINRHTNLIDSINGDSFSQNRTEIPQVDSTTNGIPGKPLIWKSVPDKSSSKFKLNTDIESDEDSDDSNKLSMAIDDAPAHSDNDSRSTKLSFKGIVHTSDDSNQDKEPLFDSTGQVTKETTPFKAKQDEIILAGEDIPAMALSLDDKVQDVKVQLILKECVRTSCMSCNYCRRAIKIAVNGKYLALHLLSEHRYTPTKNDSPEDVINKLKSSLNELSSIYFNAESFDSSDSSIFIPYDKDSTFDCFQCSFVTHSHKDLHAHKRKSHTKSLLLCIMCKINFYSYSELLCHLCPGHYNADYQLNNMDINFRCCFCRLDSIPSAFRLMVHLRKCHHTCDICLEVCSDQQKLSTHMWKHKLNHLCYRCGIAYASKLDITKHLFWKHGTESVLCKKCLQKKWPHVYHFCIPPTSFICEECNSSFSKAVALKVHKRIHAKDFSYKCTQCDKKFVSKKLLQKHEDQHNNPVPPVEQDEKGKEEIIDVTGESTGNGEGLVKADDSQTEINENQKGSDKDNETSKHHKKHKKEKKTKQVIDVYDLPPLNLSSDSDSSDDEGSKLNPSEFKVDCQSSENKDIDNTDTVNKNVSETSNLRDNENFPVKNETDNETGEQNATSTTANAFDSTEIKNNLESENSVEGDADADANQTSFSSDQDQSKIPEQPEENTSIWENFYKTNSNNKNLPYPLCAMKSEDAYKIIMGDHDYCLQVKTSDPVIKEDILQSNLECDKVDPIGFGNKIESNETTSDSSPTKKKQKSPKKKNGNNSSSSSDSSSDSDSSSCSCGNNCSCCSSSSDSSSSSSSDSDSSASEGGNKQRTEKRKKKKEKKLKIKNPPPPDQAGENKTIVETPTPTVPEEPAIRESDLDTEESSTDEEFYDRQPQKISNQVLAEKRNQLMLLASVAPVHGEGLAHELARTSNLHDASSDLSGVSSLNTDSSQKPNKKVNKSRRKKSFMLKTRKRISKNSFSFNNSSQKQDTTPKSLKPYILKLKEPKRQEKSHFISQTPPSLIRHSMPSENNSGGGSESDSVRASKRKRVPNKFYGYSSGEEEERNQQQIKWRKPETVTPAPPPLPLPPPTPPQIPTTPKFVHSTPQTPKIQLSVPKQIIRKNPDPSKLRHYLSTNESTNSSSDNDRRLSHLSVATPPPLPPVPAPLGPSPTSKQDKNLYCYCRCPYDEVSEMIACDDENCTIEWFHFECVGISVPPKGEWFCPQCSKKRGLLS